MIALKTNNTDRIVDAFVHDLYSNYVSNEDVLNMLYKLDALVKANDLDSIKFIVGTNIKILETKVEQNSNEGVLHNG